MNSLNGLKILLTGASGGIGRALVKDLCSEGAYVLGIGRNREVLHRLSMEYSKCFKYLITDLSSLEAIDTISYYVMSKFNPLDVLINNAGYALAKKLVDHDPNELIEIFMVNALTPILLINNLIGFMRDGGFIVNVITSGIHALLLDMPSYGASKIALHYMAQVLRKELSGRFKIINVYPSAVKTEFFKRAGVDVPLGAIDPRKVSKAVINALKKGLSSDIYVPSYLKITKYILGPHLLPLSFRGGAG